MNRFMTAPKAVGEIRKIMKTPPEEIEKGRELGITDSLGVGFVSFGESVQECKDLLWDDWFDGSITEFLDKPLDDGPVGSHRTFF